MKASTPPTCAAPPAQGAGEQKTRDSWRAERDAGIALIGRISAGLAHELGHPLGIAAMNVDVVRAEYERLSREGSLGPSSLGPALLDLESSVVRLQALVAGLRPFVATGAELSFVPVADVVTRIVRWAGDSLRGIEVDVSAEQATALADPTMLEQIVLHLTENAAAAAESAPSPRVGYQVVRSGERVVVTVSDNGPGVSEELHETIFEPFFTTRRAQGGVGLGLALCREYARRMGATLTMSSAPGEGACFRLSLRAAAQGADSQAPAAAE